MATTDEILTSFIRRRARCDVEMCSAEGCYRSRPASGQQANGWSLVSVGREQFPFCPWHSPQAFSPCGSKHALRRLKACVTRCQQLIRAKDN